MHHEERRAELSIDLQRYAAEMTAFLDTLRQAAVQLEDALREAAEHERWFREDW